MFPFPRSVPKHRRPRRRARQRALAAAVLAGLAAPAAAGEWTQLPNSDDFDACQFAFTGPIYPGDLTAILEVPAWRDNFRKRVCLDSPGGSLKEVYDFITLSGGDGVDFSTKVRSGARCESSCAILFMFGQSFGANSPYPDRVMEPGARLGFHSPFLSNATVAEDQREDAFRVALDVAKLLMDTSYKAVTQAGPPLSTELVSLVLSTPGDEMHHVETIGEMQLLGIERAPDPDATMRVAADRDSVGALANRICYSSYAMTFRQHIVRDGYDFGDIVEFVADRTAPGNGLAVRNLVHVPPSDYENARIVGVLTGGIGVPGWNSAGAALYCRVEIPAELVDGAFEIPLSHSYRVDFGRAFDLDEMGPDDIPDPEDAYRYDVMTAGLVPIDTRY